MSALFQSWSRDLALAARTLGRAPGFAFVTILTLGLAIGANTAIFSVVDAVLINPLDYPNADRLVSIRGTAPGTDLPEEFGGGAEFYIQYREQAQGLEDLALYQVGQTTVRSGTNVERLFIAPVSPSLYSTLSASPVLGRFPTENDEEGTVSVIGYGLWQSWFGGDPAVIGQPLEVSGDITTIIGVVGADFHFPDEQVSAWIHDLPTEPIQPGGFGLGLVGRMAPGVTHETLADELAILAQRLPERFGGSPQYARIIEAHQPIVRSLEEELVGDFASALWVLLGTAAIVLLIACSNVANLLFVRAESRRRDLAVRRALGSGRAGLIRSQMSEALLLALGGAILGVLLAWGGVPLLVRAAPEGIPGLSTVGLEPTALLFTGGIALFAALLSGLLPAIRFSNPPIHESLASSHRVGTGPDGFTRNALVVIQTAAALVLLVGSGLLIQSFRTLSSVDSGYDTEDIFTFQMAPDFEAHGLEDGPTFANFHYSFMDQLAALPGVESVGLVNTLPLDEGAGDGRFAIDGSTAPPDAQPLLNFTFAGGEYFETMGIEVVRGEDFPRDPNPTADPGAIVSVAAAELLWPGQDPIGKLIQPAGADEDIGWMTVRGVVEDVKLTDFRTTEPEPLVYFPLVGRSPESWVVGTPAYVVKSARAETIAPDIRQLIQEVVPSAPMYRVSTMDTLARQSMAELTFTMLTLGIAAALALILGAVGIYGTLSYVVTQRTREIGIRMALGATADSVRRLVISQGGRVALVGVAFGLVGALLTTRVLESLLFGVGVIDPLVFAAMSAVMVGVALLASYIPARRASAVDPIRALQSQ